MLTELHQKASLFSFLYRISELLALAAFQLH
jgi:hypothetical protein